MSCGCGSETHHPQALGEAVDQILRRGRLGVMDTSTLGQRGEQHAVEHLLELGWLVLDTNWRCSRGEIDIIARDGQALVFVEVKTRADTRAGHPLEAVTAHKLARIRRLALTWLADQDLWFAQIRIDAIGIVWNAGRPALTHVRDAR